MPTLDDRSVRLLPPLAQAGLALSALALDPSPGSGHPVVRDGRLNYLSLILAIININK